MPREVLFHVEGLGASGEKAAMKFKESLMGRGQAHVPGGEPPRPPAAALWRLSPSEAVSRPSELVQVVGHVHRGVEVEGVAF